MAISSASTTTTMVSTHSLAGDFFLMGLSAGWLMNVPEMDLPEGCVAGLVLQRVDCNRRLRDRQRLDDDESLGQARIVGDGEVDVGRMAGRHKPRQRLCRAIGERHGRLARGQI